MKRALNMWKVDQDMLEPVSVTSSTCLGDTVDVDFRHNCEYIFEDKYQAWDKLIQLSEELINEKQLKAQIAREEFINANNAAAESVKTLQVINRKRNIESWAYHVASEENNICMETAVKHMTAISTQADAGNLDDITRYIDKYSDEIKGKMLSVVVSSFSSSKELKPEHKRVLRKVVNNTVELDFPESCSLLVLQSLLLED